VRTLEQIWPVFGLRLCVGSLVLSAIRDDDIPALVDLAERGIHPPDEMPFAVPWSTAADLPHEMASHYWRTRASFEPSAWTLELVVRSEGEVVGCQGFSTANYLVTRTGETGSWLGRRYQGHGIGTLMRQAMCVLLFDHLGAREITSGAFTDNPRSLAVSRRVGYVSNGRTREKRRDGELAICQRLVLRPAHFVRPPYDMRVEGAEPVRRLIGLPDPAVTDEAVIG
jgi:RimJ/RimL family protein N-acetyltransferase